MKIRDGLLQIGTAIFDFIIFSLFLSLSLILIIPFFYMYVGIIGYLFEDKNKRTYKTIFITIKKNFKLISLFTLLNLIIILFASTNIHLLNISNNPVTIIVIFISYILLLFDLVIIINAPSLIIKMNITFLELLRNCFRFIYIKPSYFLVCLLFFILGLYLLLKFIWAIFFILYPLCFIAYLVSMKIFKIIKKFKFLILKGKL